MKTNRRLLSKLTAAVLVLAICITTVFSCITSVTADTVVGATYTVDVKKTVTPYGDKATAYLTFDLETGFVSGSFTLLENLVNPRDDEIEDAIEYLIENAGLDANYTLDDYKNAAADDENKIAINMRLAQWTYEFESVKITVSDGKAVSGEFDAADFTVTNKMYREDGLNSPNNTERHKYDRLSDVGFTATKAYTSVTFQLDYEYEYHVRVGANDPTLDNCIRLAHAEYSTNEPDQCSDGGYKNITYTDPTLIDATGGKHTASKYQPEGTLDFFHAHRWDWRGHTPVHSGNGYWIYEAECTLCGMTHHQLGNKFTSQGQSHNYYEISGINVQYEDDGTVSVNVHVPTATQNEELVICKMDGTPTKYGSIVVTPENYDEVLTDSYYAKTQYTDAEGNVTGYDDNLLPHGTKMYTIKGLSATDLKSELMLTRCVDKMYLGASHPFSLEEYAINVITGENVYYPEATTEAQKAADKEVAAAFVNYAVNASNALDNKISSKPKSTAVWSGEYKIQDEAAFIASLGDEDGNKGSGTEDDPYIISTPEQLFYISCFAGEATKDKYYKVSDRVGYFDMGAYDYEATTEQIKNGLTRNHNANSSITVNGSTVNKFFQGTFDGNGVVIYGLAGRSWRTGLFPMVTGNVTIKNLTMLSSSFVVEGGGAGAGAIVGQIEGGASADAKNNLTIENCAVKWCYFDSTASGNNSIIGTVAGMLSNNTAVTIKNCMVLDNQINSDLYDKLVYPYGGMAGFCWSAGHTFSSNICIGNTPYSVMGAAAQYNSASTTATWGATAYHGNYTDQPTEKIHVATENENPTYCTYNEYEIKQLTVDQMTGKDIKATMPYLDWSQWFTVADGTPRLRNFYQSGNAQQEVLVWDGTVSTSLEGSGTAADPYIIATPADLAYLVSGAGKTTDKDLLGEKTKDKYFKVADGIQAFDMNGFKNITLDSTVENLEKGAVKNGEDYNWGKLNKNYDNGSWFSGNFDGNYIRIYNLYCSGQSAALFPYANNTCTIKNISVENSYINATGQGSINGAGGIVGAFRKGFTESGITSQSYIENCTVRDCYILNTHSSTNSADSNNELTAAHAVGSGTWIEPHITNCFFANNTLDVSAAKSGLGVTSTTVGGVVGSTAGPNAVLTGVVAVSHTGRNDSLVKTGLIGSNTKYTFKDCYTTDSTVDTSTYGGITVLQGGYSDVLGGNAVVNMPTLHWGSVWFAGQPGKYPMLYDDGIANMPTQITSLLNAPVLDEDGTVLLEGWDSFVANYDAKQINHSFTTLDTDLNMYSSGLNLKDNPYMLVTFELMGKYREDKENVVATFTVGDQTITVKGNEMTNNEGAGRFHLVRLKDVHINNLWDAIDVKVSYNGEEILTGTLSVAGFVYKANRSGPEYEYYALAGKSLIYYSQVLNARSQIRGQKVSG